MQYRLKLVLIAITVATLLVACAPGTTLRKNPDLASGAYAVQHFDLTVEDATVTTSDSSYTVESDDYTLLVSMGDTSFSIVLRNKTSSNLTVIYDRSAASVRGLSSRVIPSNASWLTRNSPQPPSIALPKATVVETLFLVEYMYFSDRVKFLPFFDDDTTRTGDIVLSLALEVNDSPRTLVLTFTPRS